MRVACSSCSAQNRLPASRLLDKARCAACKASLLPLSRPIAVQSGEDFEELVRDAKVPVLVDFWAAWCGPCRLVAPELEKLAAQRSGLTIVAKVDTDAEPRLSARFGISSIPTLVLFRQGREAKRISGAMSASAMATQLGL
ncbi:MAG: thioredoxin TrxC [Myxococcales bacterium]|nr:MAG: thioredoxin TrxC [Myxococcales bacterium]